MSSSDLQSNPEAGSAEPEKPPLQLDVKVDSPQACLRHVVVTIPRQEVERYMNDAFAELVPDAQVPGFRQGRAPRKLVEKQFRERVAEQVKGSLLMDSLTQVTDSQEFSAISEPNFDYESIELPPDGDFRYEFEVEVRPQFDTPNWKGLELERLVEEVTEEEVDAAIRNLLGRHSPPEATDEPAEEDDILLLTARFLHDGKVLSEMDEERVRLSPQVSFSDAHCEKFGSLMQGAREGETRSGKVRIGDHAPIEALRGQEIDAEFTVIEVLRRDLPQLTDSYLRELGDFDSLEEFREFVRSSLQRQGEYRAQQSLRQQITERLTSGANWELPPDLVRRQTRRELERKVLELRRNGFDEESIRRYVNAMRQNAQASTEQALREHFILEQIAEDEKIDAEPKDYEDEIGLIAQQSDQPVRRVRARLEKSGQMDALRNQIIERRVIERITGEAKLTDKPVAKDSSGAGQEFAIYHNVLGTRDTDAIPEAKYDDASTLDEKKK